jgi:uncharacterized protein (TIGR00290 family)
MIKKSSFVSSWSGGKDSCLALYYAWQKGIQPKYLLNMIIANHLFPVKKQIISAQADAINMPIIIKKTSLENYEQNYIRALRQINQKVDMCVFGDIDCKEHGAWDKKVCRQASLQPLLPLWLKDRHKLIYNFLDLGFEATIVTVNTKYLDKSFLGKKLSMNLIKKFSTMGIDICGENGEYHTIVTDGPIFTKPLKLYKPRHLREMDSRFRGNDRQCENS